MGWNPLKDAWDAVTKPLEWAWEQVEKTHDFLFEGGWKDWFLPDIPDVPDIQTTSPTYSGGESRSARAEGRPVPVVLGRPKVAGSVLYQGSDKETQLHVVAWCEGPVKRIDEARIDGVKADDLAPGIRRTSGLSVPGATHYLGTATQTADTRLSTTRHTTRLDLLAWDYALGEQGGIGAFDVLEDGATVRVHLRARHAVSEEAAKSITFALRYRAQGAPSWTDAGTYTIKIPSNEYGVVEPWIILPLAGSGTHVTRYAKGWDYRADLSPVELDFTAAPSAEVQVTVEAAALAAGAYEVTIDTVSETHGAGTVNEAWLRIQSVEVEEHHRPQALRRTAYTVAPIPIERAARRGRGNWTARIAAPETCKVWDAAAGAWVQRWTNNPIWLAAWWATARVGCGWADAEIDWDYLKAEAAECDGVVATPQAALTVSAGGGTDCLTGAAFQTTDDYSGYLVRNQAGEVRRIVHHAKGAGEVYLDAAFPTAATTVDICEPRWRCDLVIDRLAEATAHLDTILAHCRGRRWRTPDGLWRFRSERAGAAVMTIGPAVMTRGSFSASRRSAEDLPSGLIVAYRDQQHDYDRRAVPVGTPGDDAEVHELNGCTTRTMAKRFGHWKLNARRAVTWTATCAVTLDALALEPGDIVRVKHPVTGWGYDITDPDSPLELADTDPSVKLMVVEEVTEQPGQGVRSLKLLEYVAGAYSDSPAILDPLGEPAPYDNPFDAPDPVENLKLTYLGDLTADGVWNPEVLAEWTHPRPSQVIGYRVYQRRAADPWEYVGWADQPRMRWVLTKPAASLDVAVVPVGQGGAGDFASAPTATVATPADTTPPAVPTGLTATWSDRLIFTWDQPADPDLSHYLVSHDDITYVTVADTSVEITDPSVRTYSIYVKAVDRSGNQSPAAFLQTTKPAPPPPGAADITVRTSARTLTLAVTDTYTPDPGHLGFLFQWRIQGEPTWETINQHPAPAAATVVPADRIAGTSATIEIRAAAVDPIGPGAYTDPVKTGTVSLSDGNITYSDGTPIDDLRPAEAGADKTSSHWSYDTYRVSGLSSTTVRSYAQNGDTAYNGTIEYRRSGAPSYPPTPSGITASQTNTAAFTVELRVAPYTQGTVKADYLVFARKINGIPGPADAFAIVPATGATTTILRIADLHPASSYYFAVAAGRKTDGGIVVGDFVCPTASPDWAAVTGGSPNFIADINSVPASTVTQQASNGADAYDATVLYRSPGAPSNPPTPTGLTVTKNTDGSVDYEITWAPYTQGTRQADAIVVFVCTGDRSPTIDDPRWTLPPNGSTGYFRLVGCPSDATYSFGIAALRHSEDPTRTPTRQVEVTTIQSPTAAPDWRGVSQGTPSWTGIVGTGTYSDGTPLDSLQPAEPSADRTGTNTAADTAAVDGAPASTVRQDAADGATAHDGTVNYRNPGAPTTAPTPSTIGHTANPDGTIDITITWAPYTQGARQADVLGIFWTASATATGLAPGFDDNPTVIAVPSTAGSFRLSGVPSDMYYSFGIAAGRRDDSGIVWTAIQSPAAAPDWRDYRNIYTGWGTGTFFRYGNLLVSLGARLDDPTVVSPTTTHFTSDGLVHHYYWDSITSRWVETYTAGVHDTANTPPLVSIGSTSFGVPALRAASAVQALDVQGPADISGPLSVYDPDHTAVAGQTGAAGTAALRAVPTPGWGESIPTAAAGDGSFFPTATGRLFLRQNAQWQMLHAGYHHQQTSSPTAIPTAWANILSLGTLQPGHYILLMTAHVYDSGTQRNLYFRLRSPTTIAAYVNITTEPTPKPIALIGAINLDTPAEIYLQADADADGAYINFINLVAF